jgi:hypothetical protein
VKGLPWLATESEVADFFVSLSLSHEEQKANQLFLQECIYHV